MYVIFLAVLTPIQTYIPGVSIYKFTRQRFFISPTQKYWIVVYANQIFGLGKMKIKLEEYGNTTPLAAGCVYLYAAQKLAIFNTVVYVLLFHCCEDSRRSFFYYV